VSDRIQLVLRQLAPLVRHPLQFVGVAALAALFAFLYSYGPIHASKTWRIDHLQARVDAQNLELRSLEEELAALRARADAAPEPGELKAREAAASEARRERDAARREADKAERTIASLRRSLAQWKARSQEAEAQLEEARAELASRPAAPLRSAPAAPPAAPGEDAEREPRADGVAEESAPEEGQGAAPASPSASDREQPAAEGAQPG